MASHFPPMAVFLWGSLALSYRWGIRPCRLGLAGQGNSTLLLDDVRLHLAAKLAQHTDNGAVYVDQAP